MSLRYIKRKARNALHNAMKIPALYVKNIGDPPIACNVRIHTQFVAIGKLNGYSAEFQEASPQIIFKKDDLIPDRNGFVSVQKGEAYKIDTIFSDDEYITATVAVATEQYLANLPVPENSDKIII